MGMERQISVMLKNSPGQMATVDDALAETAAKLAAAGINIDHIYGSAAGRKLVLVAWVSNLKAAQKALG